MNEHMDVLYKFSEMLDREINNMVKKGSITPSDLEVANKAICLSIKIHDHLDGSSMSDDEMTSGHWGYDYEYMPHYNRSYGRPMHGYKSHMSGHSIKDRMIARLEGMYDEAQSEHEKQMIKAEIEKIRTSED